MNIQVTEVSSALAVSIVIEKEALSLIGLQVLQEFVTLVNERHSHSETIRVLTVLILDVYRQQLLSEALC